LRPSDSERCWIAGRGAARRFAHHDALGVGDWQDRCGRSGGPEPLLVAGLPSRLFGAGGRKRGAHSAPSSKPADALVVPRATGDSIHRVARRPSGAAGLLHWRARGTEREQDDVADDWEATLDDLRERRSAARAMGGEERLAK